MTGPEDLLEAIRRRWSTAGSNLPTLIPGGLHHGRASETANGEPIGYPYAVVTITDGEPQYTSASTETAGGVVVLLFEVTVMVYVASATPNVDSKAIRAELDRMFNRDRTDDMFLTPARCIDWRVLAGGGLTLDPERSEAKDVAIVTRKWEVVIQGVV